MYRYAKLAKNNSQIELFDLRTDETVTKTVKYAGGELELPFSKTMLEAPFLVSIARPKTHCSVAMTGGIKNILVGAIHKHSMRMKIHHGNAIHSIMASLADLVYPDFAVIDGTVGMENGGPVRGKSRPPAR